MLSALQHWSYCPRQCALIHLEQAFDENVHTMRGNAAHARVDEPGFESFEGVRSERALPVWSDRLGLVGKCDVVEFHPDGKIFPVEYKHGRPKENNCDKIQLCAQALCLEEMLKADIKEAKSIWPGTISLIDHLLACKMDYIIEGVHLLPNFVKEYKDNKNVKIVFLTKIDEKKIYQGLLRNKNNGDWIRDNTKDNKVVTMAAKSLYVYGKFFLKETGKYGLKCFKTEDNFLDKIQKASDYLRN